MDQRLNKLRMEVLKQKDFADTNIADKELATSMNDSLATLLRGPCFLANKLLDDFEDCIADQTDPGEIPMGTLDMLMPQIESKEDLMTVRNRVDMIFP